MSAHQNGISPGVEGVGIIVPPTEVKEVLETTARFVGRRPAIEARVLQQHEKDPRFSFLRPADPYHAYYRSKVAESRQAANAITERKPPGGPDGERKGTGQVEGDASKENGMAVERESGVESEKKQLEDKDAAAVADGKQTTKGKAMVSYLKSFRAKEEASRSEPREPPREDLFTLVNTNPPPYSLALDVIKLTAQFVAFNGRGFLAAMSSKESRNNLFDFLKPLHPHFIIFQRLVDAYSAILDTGPQKQNLIGDTRLQANSDKGIMERVWYMHDWDCLQAEREQERAMDESERLKVAQIDWYDFIVVETVEFDADEQELPAPVADAKQLPKILAAAKRAQVEREKNKQNVDMDIDPGAENADGKRPKESLKQVNTIADIPADRIRKQAVAVMASEPTVTPEAKVALPSGQEVPLSQVEASVRAELLDPSYKKERMRAAEKNKLQNLAGGEEMARNLARFKEARAESSVYGRGDLQVVLAGRVKRVDDGVVDQKLGKAVELGPHLPEGGEVEGVPVAKRARVERAVGVLSMGKKEGNMGAVEAGNGEGDEEEVKVEGLMSGTEWIKKQGGSAVVRIRVPVHGGKEWKLEGQEIEMSAKLKSTVGKLKQVVAKYTKLPAKKQKLMIEEVGFLKDGLSLADYNVGDGCVVVLEVKERGGKRRHH